MELSKARRRKLRSKAYKHQQMLRDLFKTVSQPMITLQEYGVDEILDHVTIGFHCDGIKRRPFTVNDITYSVNVGSLRLQTFKQNRKCVKCGVEGTVMRLELFVRSDPMTPHFNLYHVREDGYSILMTRDHIIPVAKEGKDHLSNLQTMCCICNTEKGCQLPEGNVEQH